MKGEQTKRGRENSSNEAKRGGSSSAYIAPGGTSGHTVFALQNPHSTRRHCTAETETYDSISLKHCLQYMLTVGFSDLGARKPGAAVLGRAEQNGLRDQREWSPLDTGRAL